MEKKVKHLIFIIVVIFILVIIAGIFVRNYIIASQFAKPVGTLQTTSNGTLQSNINSFMESKVSPYAIGKDNYHCSNILYGYDEKYAYAWVYCSGFVVKSNNQLEQGSASSAPTRLAYTSPNYHIINFKQPSDGSLYTSTLKQLFPKEFYDLAVMNQSSADTQNLEQEVRSKVKMDK